ncbi:serine/threonine protein kinase, partial [Streptomyces sp. NPDC000405]|uniref:serine/threonine protein kinase n=1 Tax=Streptomyces sp. NPDC000405 TaxID=3161033 RepID=UPI00398C9EB1
MTGEECQRPGCAGRYEDVGDGELYCDTCGLAPVVSPGGQIASPATGITHTGGRGGSGGSGSSGSSKSSGSSGSSGSSRSSSGSSAGSSAGSSSRSSRSSSRSSGSRRSVSGRLTRSANGGTGVATRSVSVRSRESGGSGAGRNKLGAGLVAMPGVPRPDPRAAVLERPEVPERKRFCSRSDCGAPVGRSGPHRAGRTEGYCTKCGHPYSFVPKLRPGDVVRG